VKGFIGSRIPLGEGFVVELNVRWYIVLEADAILRLDGLYLKGETAFDRM